MTANSQTKHTHTHTPVALGFVDRLNQSLEFNYRVFMVQTVRGRNAVEKEYQYHHHCRRPA